MQQSSPKENTGTTPFDRTSGMMRTDAPVLLLLVLGLAVCVDYAAAGCFQWPTYTRLDT